MLNELSLDSQVTIWTPYHEILHIHRFYICEKYCSTCDAKNVASSGKKPCPGVPEQIFPDLVRSKSVPGPQQVRTWSVASPDLVRSKPVGDHFPDEMSGIRPDSPKCGLKIRVAEAEAATGSGSGGSGKFCWKRKRLQSRKRLAGRKRQSGSG